MKHIRGTSYKILIQLILVFVLIVRHMCILPHGITLCPPIHLILNTREPKYVINLDWKLQVKISRALKCTHIKSTTFYFGMHFLIHVFQPYTCPIPFCIIQLSLLPHYFSIQSYAVSNSPFKVFNCCSIVSLPTFVSTEI